jgi:hypothetical protein
MFSSFEFFECTFHIPYLLCSDSYLSVTFMAFKKGLCSAIWSLLILFLPTRSHGFSCCLYIQ